MNREKIEELRDREREAQKHGRHIEAEKALNSIGLSLFAPPFDQPTEQYSRIPNWDGEGMAKIDVIMGVIKEIDNANTVPDRVHELCIEATQRVIELVNYIREVTSEEKKAD